MKRRERWVYEYSEVVAIWEEDHVQVRIRVAHRFVGPYTEASANLSVESWSQYEQNLIQDGWKRVEG